jgi:outer membrane protein TolC
MVGDVCLPIWTPIRGASDCFQITLIEWILGFAWTEDTLKLRLLTFLRTTACVCGVSLIGLSRLAAQNAAPAAGQQQPPAGQANQSPTPAPNQPPGAAGKVPGAAGEVPGAAATKSSQPSGQPGSEAASPASGQPIALDLAGALQRAQDYNQQFQSARIAAGLAKEDRVQAKAALFPTLNALNQYIYTQGNGTPSGVFIANDGVHVYNEQAVVHAELFSFTHRAEYQRAIAAEAVARAKQDIAARGLIATVVSNYYTLITTQRHEVNARRSVEEAERFFDITQKQERGGEVAHADVIKAQLQLQQRQRELLDAQTNTLKARLALGVILFSDLGQQFNIADDLRPDTPLPSMEEIRTQMIANSPDIRAAEAGLRQAAAGIAAARGAYIPSLVLDYFYGIDANVFGIHGPDNRQNLGSVVQGTVTVPVWNWGATRSKVRQAQLQQQQAQMDLNFAQRTLQTNLNSYYLEAQAARAQLESLQSSLNLSVESLRLTVLRYQAGEATALEVVDAQSTLAQARNAYDDGLARYRIALANLQTLTGRF